MYKSKNQVQAIKLYAFNVLLNANNVQIKTIVHNALKDFTYMKEIVEYNVLINTKKLTKNAFFAQILTVKYVMKFRYKNA